MRDQSLPTAIRRSTLVDLSLVASLGAAIAAGAVWTTKITLKQDQLQQDVEELHRLLEQVTSDRWRHADMEAWVQDANREAEVWSLAAERALGLEPGKFVRFQFPQPQALSGR